ncbi:MAG: CRISPR-associated endonuclease Cas1 [Planctomycetes bacterium]|nr:CRISPR-associated endonuclease Cas1 [Planctomycetota bacterium]
MLNEFAYCQRLFYLEWVQSEFAASGDTAEGTWAHRNVDHPGGAIASPGEDDSPRARAVRLASERLGLVAVIDLVETDDGKATPVDFKRGKVPETGVWEPERVQLCVHALLLREHGYRCDEGMIYFVESRRRVAVPIDDELIRHTTLLMEQARALAASGTIPPPLIDSPKCPRCSLVGICLPDEVNELAHRAPPESEPRRLTPARDDAKPFHVVEQGARVGKSGERLVVEGLDKDGVRKKVEARLLDVSQLCLVGNVQISAQALRLLARESIPVCHFSYGGWFDAVTVGMGHKNVELRIAQFRAAQDPEASLRIARRIVEAKIRNQRTLLRRNHAAAPDTALRDMTRLAASACRASALETLLGYEGAAARAYFGQFGGMLKSDEPADFHLDGRNRRPPRDPVNAMLSFVYALLVKDLHVQILSVGLDPMLGFYHQPRYGRPALALDLAEEFRPIVADSVVISAINNGEVRATDFVIRGDAATLTDRGRRQVIAAYERRVEMEIRHPRLGYSVTYRRIFEVQTRLLSRHLLGELAAYYPFRTR